MLRPLAYLMAAGLLVACSVAPLAPEHLQTPALRSIYAAYERTVASANSDNNHDWHSGWLGNMWINLRGRSALGLCYQWKQLVYRGISPTATRVGWQAVGVVINQGTGNEHHAVVVFDPRRISRNDVLNASSGDPVYVLDPWRSGRPDVYSMEAWLKLPLNVRVPARLKEVRADAIPGPPATGP